MSELLPPSDAFGEDGEIKNALALSVDFDKYDLTKTIFHGLRGHTMYIPEAPLDERHTPLKAASEILAIIASVLTKEGDPVELFGQPYAALVTGIKGVIEDYQSHPYQSPSAAQTGENK